MVFIHLHHLSIVFFHPFPDFPVKLLLSGLLLPVFQAVYLHFLHPAGNMAWEEAEGAGQMAERFLFQEYLLRYMGRYGREHEEDALRYQIEYLITGKESDLENLKGVVNRLCILREGANAMYLMSNEPRRPPDICLHHVHGPGRNLIRIG